MKKKIKEIKGKKKNFSETIKKSKREHLEMKRKKDYKGRKREVQK